jgi:hypothetical protein
MTSKIQNFSMMKYLISQQMVSSNDFRKCFLQIFVFLMVIGTSFSVSADMIILKSGVQFKGKILRKKNGIAAVWLDVLGSDVREIPLDEILEVKKEELDSRAQHTISLMDPRGWGREIRGLKAQLIPLSEEYVIGQPMLFALVLTNASNQIAWYDPQQVAQNNPFTIKDPDGQQLAFLAKSQSTMGYARPLDAQETTVLLESFDITRFYPMVKAGKYTIQHTSFEEWVPHSNILTFEVKPGIPAARDILVSQIFQVISAQQWLITPSSPSYKSQTVSSQKVSVQQLKIFYVPESWELYQGETMELWISPVLLDMTDPEIQKDLLYKSEYLGMTDSQQHVYAYISSPIYAQWPDMKERIAKALKVVF